MVGQFFSFELNINTLIVGYEANFEGENAFLAYQLAGNPSLVTHMGKLLFKHVIFIPLYHVK